MPKWARKSQNAQIFLNLLLAVSLSIQVFDRVCLFMEEQFALVEEKEAKQKWWNEKNLEPYFDFNHEAVLYCKMDVFILMASCVKFLKQTFGFGQQMIERFGPSPAWNERRCHPIFHPFTRTIPTLGSYS